MIKKLNDGKKVSKVFYRKTIKLPSFFHSLALMLFISLMTFLQMQSLEASFTSSFFKSSSETDPSIYDNYNSEYQSKLCQENVFPNEVQLGLQLFFQLNLDKSLENIVFSPIAATMSHQLLSLAKNIVRHDNLVPYFTRENQNRNLSSELLNLCLMNQLYTVNTKYLTSNGPKILNLNGIFISDNTVLKDFFNTSPLSSLFFQKLEKVDFDSDGNEVTSLINDWIEKESKGVFKNSFIDSDLIHKKLLWVNLSYLFAPFENPFDPNFSTIKKFTTQLGEVRKVEMLSRRSYFQYYKSCDYEAVKLPYKDSTLSMIFIMTKNPYKKMVIHYGQKFWEKLEEKWTSQPGIVEIPKFSVNSLYDVKKIYHKIGDNKILENGLLKNFSEKEESDEKESSFLARSLITLEERGIGTKTDFDQNDIPYGEDSGHFSPKKFEFIANRPFSFAVYDSQSGLILFSGEIEKP